MAKGHALPERFVPAVVEVQTAMPALLDECYPVVLTHSDLNEMNILVDPYSGKNYRRCRLAWRQHPAVWLHPLRARECPGKHGIGRMELVRQCG